MSRCKKMNSYTRRAKRQQVLKTTRGRCVYCDGHATTVDHLIARILGGDHTNDNLVPSCKPCNTALGEMPLFTVAERRAWVRKQRGLAPDNDSRGTAFLDTAGASADAETFLTTWSESRMIHEDRVARNEDRWW